MRERAPILFPMKVSPDNFDGLSAKLRELADALKHCVDPAQRVALLKEFRRLLDQADTLNESLLWKSE